LQEDDADHGENHQKMNNDNHVLHKPIQSKAAQVETRARR
jgi:hypothetical protein